MNALLDIFVHRGLPLALALVILVFLRWSGTGVAAAGPESTTVAIGFMLIAAFVAGKLAARVGLPRITGYLFTGLVSGPYVSGLLTADMLLAAKAVEGLAVALIALTAGGDIRLEWVRHQLRRVALITLSELSVVVGGVLVTVMATRSLLPFMPTNDLPKALVIAGVRGLCIFAGATAGARFAGMEPVVRQNLWLGLISQAGVTLALATIVARTFPDWGAEVQALVVAMIAIHELAGPIVFQFALRRAGEIGRQPEVEPVTATHVPSTPPDPQWRRENRCSRLALPSRASISVFAALGVLPTIQPPVDSALSARPNAEPGRATHMRPSARGDGNCPGRGQLWRLGANHRDPHQSANPWEPSGAPRGVTHD